MNAEDERQLIVVGSGIAGLSLALHVGSCTLISRSRLGAGSSELAQGGLAAAMAPTDSAAFHAADTVAVAGGIADKKIVDMVTASAAEGIAWLEALGARFDRAGDTLLLGREAGHSQHRIVHADGDATGREVMRALTEAVRARVDIELLEDTHAFELLRSEGAVRGLRARSATGEAISLHAPVVVLATGGIGQVYSRTTNPIEATGDGLAMAWRSGAEVRDVEFVQFHPTALDGGRDPLPLLTEALRGAGAVLCNDAGHRFMTDIHDDAELAPRDVVARAMWHERSRGRVWLDATSLPDVASRFPTATQLAAEIGLNIAADPLPVTPSQHFHMGGVAVDRLGRSSLTGLFAVGEVAATGLHGANRLASNSLVEGLVFGRVIAEEIARCAHDGHSGTPDRRPPQEQERDVPVHPSPGVLSTVPTWLRDLMWDAGGIVRHERGLRDALGRVAGDTEGTGSDPTTTNVLTVAEMVLRSALRRRESRGAHYRSDYPAPRDELAQSLTSAGSAAPAAL